MINLSTMKTSNTVLYTALAMSMLLVACKAGKSGKNASKEVAVSNCSIVPAYASDIKSIIDKHCALSCHSAKNSAAGIDLSTYDLLTSEAKKARFMGALYHKLPYAPMPKKNPKLSDSTLKVLDCWIANGMKP